MRQTNCAALGVAADYDFQYLQSLAYLSGGNPALNEETSDSYTVGGVFQPRFLPGFALSVDYYDITVNDVITSLSAQAIINACVDLPDINNQFCGQFQRAGAGGGPRGEIQGQILENSLEVVPLNFAKLKVRGIDAQLSYRRRLGNIGQLTTQLIYTRVLENSSFLNPVTPNFGNRLNGELGDPIDAFNLDVSLKTGAVTFGYELRYLGKMSNGAYENYNSVPGPSASECRRFRRPLLSGRLLPRFPRRHRCRHAVQLLPRRRQRAQPQPALRPQRYRRGQRHLHEPRPLLLRGRRRQVLSDIDSNLSAGASPPRPFFC